MVVSCDMAIAIEDRDELERPVGLLKKAMSVND
jgi:hypothetical protein